MKERPILFRAEMVRAILQGRKTQTRRIVKPEIPAWTKRFGRVTGGGWIAYMDTMGQGIGHCPYADFPGDRLWVREGWRVGSQDRNTIWYRDNACKVIPESAEKLAGKSLGDKWKSSIHMYRWTSRIDLEVVSVRIERLQDISEKDAMAEGCHSGQFEYKGFPKDGEGTETAVESYQILWESINGKGSWALNPWVWVIEFKRIQG